MKLFNVLLLIILLVLCQLPNLGDTYGPNTISRFALVVSMAERGETTIDTYAQYTVDKAFHEGNYYSDKAPGMSFLAVPSYALLNLAFGATDVAGPFIQNGTTDNPAHLRYVFTLKVLTLMTSGVFLILATLAFLMLARGITAQPTTALLAALTFAAATPMLGWSSTLFGHAVAGSCLFLCFAAIFCIARPEILRLPLGLCAAAAGVFAGLTITVELTAAPAVFILLIYGLTSLLRVHDGHTTLRLMVIAIVTACAALAPLVAYQTLTFGSPLATGYSNVEGFEGMQQGFMGLTVPKPDVLWELTFGMRRGLIWFSPIVILAPIGFVLMYRKKGGYWPEALVCGTIVIYYFLMNAAYYYWDGGYSTGPRHVTPALPFLAFTILWVWWMARGPLKAGVVGLFLVSGAINVATALTSMTAPDYVAFPLVQHVAWSLLSGHTAIGQLVSNQALEMALIIGWFVACMFTFRAVWKHASQDDAA